MQPKTDLEKFRAEFIQNFSRIPWNSTPEDARFLRVLIESTRAKNGLEIGVATGYGAMVMGLGFERNGGRLTSIDPDAEMVKTARANIRKMHLDETVSVVKGPALKVIPKLPGRFDFVFIDALKKEYLGYFRTVEPKLKPRAVVVADNVIQQADAMRDFLEAMRHDAKYHSVIIRASDEKGDGMMVISKAKQRVAMPRLSAGLLMYRMRDGSAEVLLAHPGGPYFAKKDEAAWTMPKGEPEAGEELLFAARREFEEETGIEPNGSFLPLAPIKQKGGKIVHAWAFQGECDPATIVSNTFTIEWPPRSGRQQKFPEIDRAQWFDLTTARKKIKAGQDALIDELERRLFGN